MSLNWQEIDAVLGEWRLDGAELQNIVQPDFEGLFLEFYREGTLSWVYVGLQAGLTRLHLAAPPARSKDASPRFCAFLRARYKGARLLSVQQLGTDRLVVFRFVQGDETLSLVARLWSNAANILALDHEGRILDAYYRRPAKQETSGGLWTAPPERAAGDAERQRFPVRSWQPSAEVPNFNAFIAASYRESSAALAQNLCRGRVERGILQLQSKLEARRQNLERQLKLNANPERLKQMGEMLLAYRQGIRRGERWFETDDWYQPGTRVRIELDERLDATANAERYIQRFQKARDGQRYLSEELEQTRAQLARLAADQALLSQELDTRQLTELAERLDLQTALSGQKNEAGDQVRPGLAFESHGFTLFIGRNVAENDELLRRHVRGNDWWLHVRDLPGGYVFVKVPKTKTVPLEVLLDAAHLAIWYSKAKQEPEVDLFYTQVKYLRRAKHGTYGLVIPTRERNLHVRVEPERNRRLLGILNQAVE